MSILETAYAGPRREEEECHRPPQTSVVGTPISAGRGHGRDAPHCHFKALYLFHIQSKPCSPLGLAIPFGRSLSDDAKNYICAMVKKCQLSGVQNPFANLL